MYKESPSQLGTISDTSLSSLRDQIKKVMIPMLIKIFQLKLELSQAVSLPSRLQPKSQETPDSLLTQLRLLDEDLKLLSLWCESARGQITKALTLPNEERASLSKTTTTPSAPHPGIAKSFSTAMTSAPSSSEKPKKWWHRF